MGSVAPVVLVWAWFLVLSVLQVVVDDFDDERMCHIVGY